MPGGFHFKGHSPCGIKNELEGSKTRGQSKLECCSNLDIGLMGAWTQDGREQGILDRLGKHLELKSTGLGDYLKW